jgi:hypothetical protein
MDRTVAVAVVDTVRGGNTRRAKTTPEAEARNRNRSSNTPAATRVADIQAVARTSAGQSMAVRRHRTARAKTMTCDAVAAVNAAAVAPSREVARRSPRRARFVSPATPVRVAARLTMTAKLRHA